MSEDPLNGPNRHAYCAAEIDRLRATVAELQDRLEAWDMDADRNELGRCHDTMDEIKRALDVFLGVEQPLVDSVTAVIERCTKAERELFEVRAISGLGGDQQYYPGTPAFETISELYALRAEVADLRAQLAGVPRRKPDSEMELIDIVSQELDEDDE